MANPVGKPTMMFVGGRGTKAGDALATGCTVASFTGNLANYMGADGECLASELSCSAGDDGNSQIRLTYGNGAFTGVVVGTLARCTGGLVYPDGIYEIIGIDATNAAYIDIDVSYSAGDDIVVSVGGAFPDIQSCLDDDITLCEAADTYYYSRYICTNKNETLAATVTFQAETTVATKRSNNAFTGVIGFNTSLSLSGKDIVSDCDLGGAYYQGAWSSFRRDKSFTDHNPSGTLVHWDFNDNTVHCISFLTDCCYLRNLKIGNNSGTYFTFENATYSGYYYVLENCWTYDTYDICNTTGNSLYNPRAYNCYFGSVRASSITFTNRMAIQSENCIYAMSTYGISTTNHFNTLFYGHSGIAISNNSNYAINCIFYNQTTACVSTGGASTYFLFKRRCIFSPSAANKPALKSGSNTISNPHYRREFASNLAWCVDADSALDYIDYMSTAVVRDELNCIELNPKFVNPADGDFRLQPDSPCLNRGTPDLFGGFSTIGPFDYRASNLTKGKQI